MIFEFIWSRLLRGGREQCGLCDRLTNSKMLKVAIKREQSKLVWSAEREQLGRSPNKTKSIKKLNNELFCDKVRKREFIEVALIKKCVPDWGTHFFIEVNTISFFPVGNHKYAQFVEHIHRRRNQKQSESIGCRCYDRCHNKNYHYCMTPIFAHKRFVYES